MRPIFNNAVTSFCLIASLLWAQIAVAQHNAEHDLSYVGHEVSEVCETYASADNSKITLGSALLVANIEFGLEALRFDTHCFLKHARCKSAAYSRSLIFP